jgi:hypothetical protein
MLSDTLSLGTTAVSFVKRSYSGSSSTYAPTGETPSTARGLRVSHEVTSSGRVNTLFAVSHVKANPSSPTGETQVAAVQVKIIRPAFVSATDMKTIIDQVITGLSPFAVQDKLLNQEV